MRVDKLDSSLERKILIGLIVDGDFLSRVTRIWKHGMLNASYSNQIADWCVSHYKTYAQPPGKNVESIFERWARTRSESDKTVDLIEEFLSTLSEEYEALSEEVQSEYLSEQTVNHINRVRVENLTEQLDGMIRNREDTEAMLEEVMCFSRVEMGLASAIDMFDDKGAIERAINNREKKSIVQYSGALGEFMGRTLGRDCLVSFMGSEKRGKSWWLMDVAYRAAVQRKNVALFEAGDMSEEQVMERFLVRALNRPLDAGTWNYPVSLVVPADPQDGSVIVKKEKYNKNVPVSVSSAKERLQARVKSKLRGRGDYLKLSVHPAASLSVSDIDDTLQRWEEELDWIPDVIVIDYADVLAPSPGTSVLDERARINDTWMRLRGLSQKRHCLVVTATQADAVSYETELLTRSNFSEDKRKLAHVTGIIGLNQNEEEEQNGRMRLNWIVRRNQKYSASRVVHVAGCLDVGNPACVSSW